MPLAVVQASTATMENWQYLLKLNICIIYDSATLLLAIYPMEMHVLVFQKTNYNVIAEV